MAETKIEWADFTFNPWIGCTKVAPGCTHCYAEAFSKRTGKAKWGDNGTRIKTSESNWNKPLKWNRDAEKEGVRRRVFCASLADVFEDWGGDIYDHHGARLFVSRADPLLAPIQEKAQGSFAGCRPMRMADMRERLFRSVIDKTPWLDWLVLTKRPENILRMWPFSCDNVWLGCSVSEQDTANVNVPELLKCRALSPVLWISYEPAVDQVDFTSIEHDGAVFNSLQDTCCPLNVPKGFQCAGPGCNGVKLDWIIVGGESGGKSRAFDVSWARWAINQCRSNGVPCFVKQLGAKVHDAASAANFADEDCWPDETKEIHQRFLLKDSKGGDMAEWPKSLRVREFPL